MKTRSILICCVLLALTVNLYAGGYNYGKKHKSAAKTTLLDPGEGDYDIKHLKFNLKMSDTSVFVQGDVTTTAQVIATSMSNYIFELNTLMIIDSAKVNGTLLAVTNVGFVRTIALSSALPNGSVFTAQIFYHGTPPPGGSFFNGLRHSVSASGTHMVYSVSDPWVALNWWPTKQSVNDKIDSVDMFINVPSGVVDGSNGLLINVDNVSVPGRSIYHWQTHYPITYYLISIAIARFSEYKSYWHFTTSPDSMLIQNFFMDTATFNPVNKIRFDSIGLMIDYFSNLYGVRYPFWQEKYGVCYTDLPGGMEHQTMTTIGVPYTYVIAHELTHQWFGDNVSYKSWHETWLSEAFATYAEQLFYTHFWNPAKGKNHRLTLLGSIIGNACGMVYVNDTTNSDSLFFQPAVYNKGQAVLHMLRYIAPTDSQFFQIFKTYQQNFALGNATGADLKGIAEATYGFVLDTFFNQWIYGRGYPIYRMSWDQVGTTVYVKLTQTTSCSYTPHFSTPLELQLHSATADTFIKVYNTLDTQIYTFDWSQTMTNVYLNPDVWTICRLLGAVTKDTTLRIGTVIPHNIKIFPNPSKNFWQVDQVADNTALVLTDINGRILWQGNSDKGSATIPGEGLPPGNYLLKVNGNNTESIKLVHW